MSCTLEDLTDPRIRLEELWVMEKQYCGNTINKINLIELFLFYFNRSSFPVFFISLVFLFIFFRICNLLFDKIFFSQLDLMVKRKKLFETEIALFIIGIPFFLLNFPRGIWVLAPSRNIINLINSNGLIIMGMTLLPLQLIFFNKNSIKFLQNLTSVTITCILCFVVYVFIIMSNKKMNYFHVALGFVLGSAYLVFVYLSIEKDKMIELAWKRNHPNDEVEQVYFYPEDENDEEEEEEEQAGEENQTGEEGEEESYGDLISDSELIDDLDDAAEESEVKEPEPEPEIKTEDKEKEALKEQDFDEDDDTNDQDMKAQIIDELEEELKEKVPFWIKVRRLYIDDEFLSTYALDNMITYIIIIGCILFIPSGQNPFVSKRFIVIPLFLGYIFAYYNLFEKKWDSLIGGTFLFLIHLSIRSFMKRNNKLFIDSIAVFVFIWMIIIAANRYFKDLIMFFQFFYDFHVSIKYCILGLTFIVPFMFFNIEMMRRGRTLLAIASNMVFITSFATSIFVSTCIRSLMTGMNIFDYNHPDFLNSPITYIVPLQEIFVALICIVFFIYMMLNKSVVNKIFGLALLLIFLCYGVCVYMVAQLEFNTGFV